MQLLLYSVADKVLFFFNNISGNRTDTDGRGVARIFQRGGGWGSHCVKVRVLTRLTSFFRYLLKVVCLKKAYKGGHRNARTPLLASPLHGR